MLQDLTSEEIQFLNTLLQSLVFTAGNSKGQSIALNIMLKLKINEQQALSPIEPEKPKEPPVDEIYTKARYDNDLWRYSSKGYKPEHYGKQILINNKPFIFLGFKTTARKNFAVVKNLHNNETYTFNGVSMLKYLG